MDSDPIISYTIADLSLRGILIIPLIVIWVVSLFLVRRQGDKARLGFTYMKVAYPLWLIYVILVIASDAMIVLRLRLEDSADFDPFENTSDFNTDNRLYNISVRLGDVANLFTCAADIAVLMCTVELANGFLYCLDRTRTVLQKVVRYTALGIGALLFVLCIAQLGVYSASYTKYFNYQASLAVGGDSQTSFNEVAFEKGLDAGRNLGVAFDAIIFATSVGLIAYASYVLHRVISIPAYQNSAIILLVITILQLLRYCWWIAVDAMWEVPGLPVPYETFDVADPILNTWTMFVSLVLMFVIGLRKGTGLWSTPQPWGDNVASVPQQPPPAVAAYYQAPAPGHPGGGYVHPAPVEHAQVQIGQTPMPEQATPPGELNQPASYTPHEVKAN